MATKKENLPLTMEEDMEQTSSITYANEVVSIIAGVVFLHEVFTPFQVVGAIVILISVFFANRQ